MKLLEGTKAIEQAIKSIQTRGKRLDKDIHLAGCSSIQHIEKHGDCIHLNNLIKAMPKGSRVNALQEWANTYAKVKYNDETKEFTFDKTRTTLLDDAIENSWTTFKPEAEYKPLDFNAALHILLKKAYARCNAEGAKKGDKINSDVLKKVAAECGYKHEVK